MFSEKDPGAVCTASLLASEQLEQDADVAAKIIRTFANPFADRKTFGGVDAPIRHSESSDSAPIPQRVGTACELAFSVSYMFDRIVSLCLSFNGQII